ncbi:MAG: serine/threonine-protein phosphatase [Acidobacteria bacterium]|nr:MAG: serine/threonine-protein phosphatase [Acidobacteriota bacterium]
MNVSTCVSTTQGLRNEHQDRYCIEHSTLWKQPALILAVADGMGGLEAGGAAAESAIETVRDSARHGLPTIGFHESPRLFLRRLFQKANERIWRFSQDHAIESMGTTLVLALFFGRNFLVAHVGDSRCYVLNGPRVHTLTQDHSVAEEMAAKGQLSRGTRLFRQLRHQLTRSLGEPHRVPVALFPARRGLGMIPAGHSVFLLCSDGLHGEVGEHEVMDEVSRDSALEERCSRLVLRALKNGSTDNITVVAAEIEA